MPSPHGAQHAHWQGLAIFLVLSSSALWFNCAVASGINPVVSSRSQASQAETAAISAPFDIRSNHEGKRTWIGDVNGNKGVARTKRFAVPALLAGLKFSTVFSHTASAVTIIDFIRARVTDSTEENQQEIRDLFANLDAKMNNLQGTMKQLFVHTTLQHVMTRHYDVEKFVGACIYHLKKALTLGSPSSECMSLPWRITGLLRSALGQHVFGGDILEAMRDLDKCHARKFLKSASRMMEFINVGIGAAASYAEISLGAGKSTELLEDLIPVHGEVLERIKNISDSCGHLKADQIKDEMKSIMRGANESLSHKQVADQIYAFLADKYELGRWWITVYGPAHGFSKHTIGTMRGTFYSVFREANRNAVAIQVPHYHGNSSLQAVIEDVDSFCRFVNNETDPEVAWIFRLLASSAVNAYSYFRSSSVDSKYFLAVMNRDFTPQYAHDPSISWFVWPSDEPNSDNTCESAPNQKFIVVQMYPEVQTIENTKKIEPPRTQSDHSQEN